MKSKDQKREEAVARNLAYRFMSKVKRIARLDARLGKGVGAVKERARLA